MKTMILVLMVLSSCGEVPSAPVTQNSLQNETQTTEKTAVAKEESAVIVNEAPVNGLGVETRAVKLTMDNCVDPDLALVYKDVVLTMCDGTAGAGTYQPPQFDTLVAENIKSGVVIGSVTGSYVTPNPAELIAENVKAGVTVNGVVGSYNNRPVDCAAGNLVGCVSTSDYKSVAVIAPTDLKLGVQVNGTVGTYNNRPVDCNDNGQSGCVTSLTYKSASFNNLTAGNIKEGVGIAGILGTVVPSPANCTATDQIGCVTTGTFRAMQTSAPIVPCSIQKGATIGGVIGAYPSAACPLNSSSVTDITTANFDATIKYNVPFQWFDRAGTLYSRSGDADLGDAGNIKDGVTIFGTVGTLPFAVPDAWDIRKGVTISGVAGKLPMNCRDGDYDAADTACHMEDSWVDKSVTSTGTPATCGDSGVECKYQDKISGLTWFRASAAQYTTPLNAQLYCLGVTTIDGVTGWRAPSRVEVLEALAHQMFSKVNASMFSSGSIKETWTTTPALSAITPAGYYATGQFNISTTSAVPVPTSKVVNCVK